MAFRNSRSGGFAVQTNQAKQSDAIGYINVYLPRPDNDGTEQSRKKMGAFKLRIGNAEEEWLADVIEGDPAAIQKIVANMQFEYQNAEVKVDNNKPAFNLG